MRASSTTVRVSANTANVEPDNDSFTAAPGSSPRGSAFSATGRYVVFNSGATDLVTGGPTGGGRQIFVRDRDTDNDGIFDEPSAVATELISKDDADVESGGANDEEVISPDGRFVVFVTGSIYLESGGVASCGGGTRELRGRHPPRPLHLERRDGAELRRIDRVSVGATGGEQTTSTCVRAYRPTRATSFDSLATDLGPADHPPTGTSSCATAASRTG
jgi:hypothetical protein